MLLIEQTFVLDVTQWSPKNKSVDPQIIVPFRGIVVYISSRFLNEGSLQESVCNHRSLRDCVVLPMMLLIDKREDPFISQNYVRYHLRSLIVDSSQ